MLLANRFVTGGATIALALGIGFVMNGTEQRERAELELRQAKQPAAQSNAVTMPAILTGPEPAAPAEPKEIMASNEPLDLEEVQLTNAKPPVEPAQPENKMLNAAAPLDDEMTAAPQSEPTPQLTCDIVGYGENKPAALVEISVDAACLPNERVTIHHNGMMITTATDDMGLASVTVPALSEAAVFIIAFPSGDADVVTTMVPDIAQYDRVAVQWQGANGLELHAREFGADYNTDGHIWAETPRHFDTALNGTGGFMMMLGEDVGIESRMAQVYTFPKAASSRGAVEISVEAAITDSNCDREVTAQTLEMRQGEGPRVQDLSLSMPGCDAVGDFLVLKNVVEDLKLAVN